MNMYAPIEDARTKAWEAALNWEQSEEAQELLAKADAMITLSGRWCSEVPDAAKAFSEAVEEAEDALDDLRRTAINAYADACSNDRDSDEWFDAWEEADNIADTVKECVRRACRRHAGDEYLRRFG